MITVLDSDNEGCHEGGGDGAHEEPNALTEEQQQLCTSGQQTNTDSW